MNIEVLIFPLLLLGRQKYASREIGTRTVIASGPDLPARLHNINCSRASRCCDVSRALMQTMLILHQSMPEGSLVLFKIKYALKLGFGSYTLQKRTP